MNQMKSASSKQTTTAICLLETVLRTREGMYLDHLDGVGDLQKDEVEEKELAEDERELSLDGRENMEIEAIEGVASSLGDLSTKGSLPGVLKTFLAVRSRKPISAAEQLIESMIQTQKDERMYELRPRVAWCKHLAWRSQLQVLLRFRTADFTSLFPYLAACFPFFAHRCSLKSKSSNTSHRRFFVSAARTGEVTHAMSRGNWSQTSPIAMRQQRHSAFSPLSSIVFLAR